MKQNYNTNCKIVPHCPECLTQFNVHESATGEYSHPKKGDLSLCCYCGHISKFQKNGMLVNLQAKDHIQLIKKDLEYYKHLFKTSILIGLQAVPGHNTSAQFN